MFNVVNNQFQKFYDFAQARKLEGKSTAIAKIDDNIILNAPLEERSITAKKGDFIGKFRFKASKDVNNSVRTLFRQTVIDMFGGEKNIPDSVKTAMLLKDYGKGKPLTARRIDAVATAIQALGMENAFEAKGAAAGELARRAEEAGFDRQDFAKLSLAANLYVKAFGGSLKDALLIVLDRSSGIGDAAVVGQLDMKDVNSFKSSLTSALARNRDTVHAFNLTLSAAAAGRRDTNCFASVARNNAAYLRGMLGEPAAKLQNIPNYQPQQDPLAKLRTVIAEVADEYDRIAQRIENGEIPDEKQALKQVLNNDGLNSRISTATRDTVRTLKKAAVGELKQPLDEVVKLLPKLDRLFTESRNDCVNAFKVAYAEREQQTAINMLENALRVSATKNGKKAHDLPKSIVDGMKKFIAGNMDKWMEKVETLCKAIEDNGTDGLYFSDTQKTRLKTLLVNVLGSDKAEKAMPGLIDELEGALLSECLLNSRPLEETLARPRIDTILAHLEKHPKVLTAMNVGFNLDNMDKVKKAIMDEMQKDLQTTLTGAGTASFSNGMMKQSVREYVKGYVTFNGQPISDAKTEKEFFSEANNYERRGYAEFLEEKFPAGKEKMRQTVSFLCGMALGIGGAIDTLLREGVEGDDKFLLGMPRNEGMEKHSTAIMSRNMNVQAGENYDITMDDDGNVTIKLTHYAVTTIDSIDHAPGERQGFLMLDGQQAKIGLSKMVVTVKVPNVSDADLGDKMPAFEIADLTQELL